MEKSKLTPIERVDSIKAWIKDRELKQPVGFLCNVNPAIKEHAYRLRYSITRVAPTIHKDDLV